MRSFFRLAAAVLIVAFSAAPALAQWQVPVHTVPVGRGGGVTGFLNTGTGSSGQVLTSNGASADPTWQAGGSTGTVTSITAGTGLTGGTITTSGTISLDVPVTVPNGGTGATTLGSGLPLFGAGTSPITTGTLSGSTTKLATSTGSLISGDCVKLDASSNYVDAGGNCGVPALTADLNLYVRTAPATITISIASPAVVSWTAHGLSVNSPVVFNTDGALPTGLTAGTIYYVIAAGFGVDSFEVSDTLGGTAVDTSGTQSGTQTAQTGDDAHDCSAATIANACLTIQHGVDLANNYDFNQFNVIVNVSDGLYAEDVQNWGNRSMAEPVSTTAQLNIIGNDANPQNVIIEGTSASLAIFYPNSKVFFDGFTVQGGLAGIESTSGSSLGIGSIIFGPVTTYQVFANFGGEVLFGTGYTISGGAVAHWYTSNHGIIDGSLLDGQTITLTGTPAFSTAFALTDNVGSIVTGSGINFSGSATGSRYAASINGTISTNSAGTTYFPGDAPGTLESGGQYDDTGPAGTVTSVALSAPTEFTVSGSPVTTSGTLDFAWANPVSVAHGGTGLTAGTSGGIPYYSSTSTIASSGALTNHAIVLGGGAGASPTALGSLGTTTSLLHGNAAGAPTFGAVSLSADVTGNLPPTNLNSGTSASSSTFWRGDGTWATPSASATSVTVGTTTVTSGTDTRILFDNAGVLGEYTLTGSAGSVVMSSSPTIASPTFSGTVAGANTIPLSILAQSGANTMLGNWTGSTANVAANSMPSCADSGGNHLNYVSGTGVTCGTSGSAPSGSAGGDLSGTYPNPTVAKVNAVTYPSGPSANTVPVVTSATSGGTVTYEAVPSAALNLTTTTCTNQFVTAISAGGVGTCTTDVLASAQHANQGTTTQVLHGNASGNPSWGAVANADLANSATTVNGQTCTLGSTCTVTAAASGVTVGTTTVSSGTTTRVLFDNAGVLGEYTISGSVNVCMTTSCQMTTPDIGAATGASLVLTGTGAQIIAAGRQGGTTPVFSVDASVATNVSGVKITGNASGSRANVAVTSSATDEGLSIDAKGAGTVRLGATSTGAVEFSRNAVPTASDGAALGTTGLQWSDLFLASGGVINFANGNYTLTHTSGVLTASGAFSVGTSNAITAGTIELGAASDTTLSRFGAGVLAVEGGAVYPGIPITSKSAAYTTVLADANTTILHPASDANARTFTIDSNANVAYPIGTTLEFINLSANNVTIAITTDTMTLIGAGSTGSRTLAQYGQATAQKLTSTTWVISGQNLT